MVIYTLLDVRQVVDPHYGLHVGSHDGALNCKATGGVLSLVGFVITKTHISISLSYNWHDVNRIEQSNHHLISDFVFFFFCCGPSEIITPPCLVMVTVSLWSNRGAFFIYSFCFSSGINTTPIIVQWFPPCPFWFSYFLVVRYFVFFLCRSLHLIFTVRSISLSLRLLHAPTSGAGGPAFMHCQWPGHPAVGLISTWQMFVHSTVFFYSLFLYLEICFTTMDTMLSLLHRMAFGWQFSVPLIHFLSISLFLRPVWSKFTHQPPVRVTRCSCIASDLGIQ